MYVLSLALLIAAGSTIAWLIDESEDVVNVFTPSNIDITLDESENLDLQMVPGNTIAKDPKVTVEAGSVDCWLFIKIVESNDLDKYISYTVADGWNSVEGHEGFYYRTAEANDTFSILAGDQVTVNDTVEKSDMDDLYINGQINEDVCPTLTFYAAAIQQANVTTVTAAWNALPTEFTGATSNP